MSLLQTYFQPLCTLLLTIISHIPHFKYSYTASVYVTDCPLTHFVGRISPTVDTLARHFSLAWLCQQSYCRGTGVRRLSANSAFSETPAWIKAKSYRKLPIHHISRHLFSFFKIFTFHTNFVFIFVNMGPRGSKNVKMLFLSSFHPI